MQFLFFKSFIPEIFLSFSILFQLLYNTFIVNSCRNRFPIISKEILIQTSFLLFSLLLLFLNNKCEIYCFNFLFLNDLGAIKLKSLIIILSLSILIIIFQNFEIQKLNFFEFFIIFLLALFSLLLLINTTDLLSTYLIIEMQALCFYILACFKRDSAFSTEAGLKYFIGSSFISIIFLFSSSIIYAILGTLNFNYLNLLLYFDLLLNNNLLLSAHILILSTLFFKLVIVPFHFWAPDVYEGSPLSSTVIFALLPKISLFYFLIKWLLILNNNLIINDINSILFAFFGLMSIFIGLSFAIQQKRLKRFIIYSSISQLGFIVAGLAIVSYNMLSSIYFFLIVYLFTSIIFWLIFSSFYSFQNKIRLFYNSDLSSLYLTALTNFNKINLIWSCSLLILFFCIAGLPPLVGFFSKIFIIFSLIESNHLFLAIFIILLSLIGPFYYLRVLKIIYFEPTFITIKNNTCQILFSTNFFILNCFIISFLLFLLCYLFIHPTFLFFYCQSIVINQFLF